MNDKPAAQTNGSAPLGGAPRRPPGRLWSLNVVEAKQVTPRMRRVILSGETLDELDHKPGQDVVLILPQYGAGPVRRHYTIRWSDKAAKRVAIDFVMHGDTSPAMRWLQAIQPGDRIDAQGPRGRTVVNSDADWHLFTGDETCLPGIFAMIESLPEKARAIAYIEVAGKAEKQEIDARANLTLKWIYRDGPAKPSSPELIAQLQALSFPPGRGQAYVIGETSTVRAQRQGLIARRFDKSRIAAEGYWRPGRHGGHDHIWDEGEGPQMIRPGMRIS